MMPCGHDEQWLAYRNPVDMQSEQFCVFCELERLRAQLPDGMQYCTIQFLECEKGHGRLTATNWVKHGCDTCEIERLQEIVDRLPAYRDGSTWTPDSIGYVGSADFRRTIRWRIVAVEVGGERTTAHRPGQVWSSVEAAERIRFGFCR